MRTWRERLDQLWESRQLVSWLVLARQLVAGKAVAVVGLPHRRSKRKAALQEKITTMVVCLMDGWHVTPVSQPNQVSFGQNLPSSGYEELLNYFLSYKGQ